MARQETTDPQETFLEFLKKEKYRQRISQMAIQGKESIAVDFEELFAFDQKLALALLEKPDEYLDHANKAAYQQLGIEDQEYAQKLEKVTVRITQLLGPEQLRKLGSKQMGKLVMIEAIVIRATPVRPMVMQAAFKCKRCGTLTRVEQTGPFMKAPFECSDPSCKQKGPFEFNQEESSFIDSQDLRLQERPEDLPPGQLPRTLNVKLIGGEIVDVARPGDHVSIVGIVRAFAPSRPGIGKLRTFILQLDANSIEVLGKEPETAITSAEEEEKIIALSKDPWIHRKLMSSIAPSIYGYEHIKEAIMYLLFGGVSKNLPDITIRGEMNALLIGDPGCLVADERVLLGNGKIAKIGSLGAKHLQPISVRVKTGHGANQRAMATAFHVYRQQPIIEIVTESGKSLKGTYNQPVLKLVTDGHFGSGHLRREWIRLDELKLGDRIAVVRGFTCQLKNYVPTGFMSYGRKQKNEISLPAEVEPSLAGLFGYIIGDGGVDDYRVTLYVVETEKDLMDSLLGMVRGNFGVTPEIYRRKRKNRSLIVFNMVIHSVDLAHNLSFLTEKRVPKLIFESPNDCVSEFLRWLFEADGTVFDKGRGRRAVALKAKDIELLRDVQLLLLRFGIHSRIVGIDSTNPTLTIRRGLDIIKYQDKIGFASQKKRTKLAVLAEHAKTFRRGHQKQYERIIRITKRQAQDVYDIEVPESHSFVANGIVVHNTAKSQLLQYVARIAPRGLYTSGRGTTAAGLTAAVIREKGGSMSLEAGALVLADKGIACIDEMDKMRPEDRVAIHEAMEQHTVSVAKGGIVATLNARTAVLAAANPALGRYEPHRTVAENISLPVTILSRFDIIFVLRDVPDREADGKMSKHILEIHRRGLSPVEAPVDAELMRKYVSYAKMVKPELSEEALKRLGDFYLAMRGASETEGSPVAITARQLESLVRIAEARARAALRKTVTGEDAEAAISLMRRSLEEVGIDMSSYKMDIDIIMTGKPKSVRDKLQVVLSTVIAMEKETGTVEKEALVAELEQKHKISRGEIERMIGQLLREGTLYEPGEGRLKKT
ncbi:MAG: LAGLIDADG family homing endonuclease [Candidatus Bathyarchaeia archaeon]